MPRWLTIVALTTWLFGCGGNAAKPASETATAADGDALVSPSMCPPLSDQCTVNPPPSYKDTIAPMLEERCSSCHTGLGTAPWPLDSWGAVAEWADLVAVSVDRCTMPPADAGVPFTAAERRDLRNWIICGAPNN